MCRVLFRNSDKALFCDSDLVRENGKCADAVFLCGDYAEQNDLCCFCGIFLYIGMTVEIICHTVAFAVSLISFHNGTAIHSSFAYAGDFNDLAVIFAGLHILCYLLDKLEIAEFDGNCRIIVISRVEIDGSFCC